MSVPQIVSSKYKFNAGSRTNLIVIKPEKCKINEQKLFLKLGLLNIRSLTPKAFIVNEIITDNSFDVLCLTETWLKTNDYFGLNESTPPSYCYKHEPRQTGRGGGVATIYSDILNVTQKTGYRFNSFKILMLNVKLSDKQNKSILSLALATVYRPPRPYTHFLKEFADFLSDLLVNVDKALIIGDFNIHVDNTNDALGLAFTDLMNSFGVKQNVTGPTHRFNHTLDLIISHGIDLTDINIKSNQIKIKSLLLSHHHSTSALVSEILMSVLQTVQKNNRQFTYGQTVQKNNNRQFTYGQTVQKKKQQQTIYNIIPQSDDVTDHFLVSCMLHITDINYIAPHYHPARIIIPATNNRFTNNLPDLSQLLCVPINTDELDTITSNMGTIFSNTLETVAPIKLKKV